MSDSQRQKTAPSNSGPSSFCKTRKVTLNAASTNMALGVTIVGSYHLGDERKFKPAFSTNRSDS